MIQQCQASAVDCTQFNQHECLAFAGGRRSARLTDGLKLVLQHPLAEVLAGHGCFIFLLLRQNPLRSCRLGKQGGACGSGAAGRRQAGGCEWARCGALDGQPCCRAAVQGRLAGPGGRGCGNEPGS